MTENTEEKKDFKLSDLPENLEWLPIISTNLERAAFDAENNHIFAKFKKNPVVYRYEKGKDGLFDDWRKTFDEPVEKASSGGFHHAKIKALPFVKFMPEKKAKEEKTDEATGK